MCQKNGMSLSVRWLQMMMADVSVLRPSSVPEKKNCTPFNTSNQYTLICEPHPTETGFRMWLESLDTVSNLVGTPTPAFNTSSAVQRLDCWHCQCRSYRPERAEHRGDQAAVQTAVYS